MECLGCFVTDEYQDKLRRRVQVKADRLENVLEEYKKLFIAEFRASLQVSCCDSHDHYDFITKLSSIEVEEIEELFNDIINSYIKWINGDNRQAIVDVQDIFNNNNLIDCERDISDEIMFRGRCGDISSKKELFHIPFNKRFHIKNQRYSLTGQPLLYLGFSVFDVVKELRVNVNDISSIKFSTFVVEANEFLVYDFTNEFHEYFIENSIGEIGPDNEKEWDYKKMLFKLILSSVCSFKSRMENVVFSEEYVLPQLVSQVVKESKKYRGILYASTRTDGFIGEAYNTHYKENIAVFTTYDKENNLDDNLFKEFSISVPLGIKNMDIINMNDLIKVCNDIIELADKYKVEDEKIQKKIEYFTDYYARIDMRYSDTKIVDIDTRTEIEYLDHKIGKLHLCLVNNFLTQIKDDIILGGESYVGKSSD